MEKETKKDEEKAVIKNSGASRKKTKYEVVLVTPTHMVINIDGNNVRKPKEKDVKIGDKVEA